jgi:hypothetical protein
MPDVVMMSAYGTGHRADPLPQSWNVRFVEDRSEHTVLLGGAEPVEPCRQRAAITELFRGHSIYVSSELFQTRSATAELSNV